MIKVVLTGPESSGKTTLAEALAIHYGVNAIPEFARQFLKELDRDYSQYDLTTIALAQYRQEQYRLNEKEELIICDTSLLVIKIWSQFKYKSVHPSIISLLSNSLPDLYILPHFDIPYEYDPLRENPKDRKELFQLYRSELDKMKIPWIIVKGSPEERMEEAQKAIDSLLAKSS